MRTTSVLIALLMLTGISAYSQKTVRVSYKSIVNGQKMPGGPVTVIESDGKTVKISSSQPRHDRPQMPAPQQTSFIDLTGSRYIQMAAMPDGSLISTFTPFSDLPSAEPGTDTEIIAGYRCIRSRVIYFSNTIDIWYTTDAGVTATPVPAYGVPDGLVLRVVRNGNNVTEADTVEFLRKKDAVVSRERRLTG